MIFKHIKRILIIGILWTIFASLLRFIFADSQSDLIFFAFSIIGQCVFMIGLFLLDRKAKSMLSSYYAILLCISLMLYYLKSQEFHNIFVDLCLALCFFFALFRYLQIFTNISGQALFIRSFYVLFCSIILGILLLSINGLIKSNLLPFILGFMVLPSFFMYLVALFSLRNVSLEKFNKVIT